VIRLHDGETNLLAGLIRDDERRVLQGVPGLSDLPLIGHLFAYTKKETQETDIVLTLTPRIMRVLDLSEEDLRPFRVGRDVAVGGGGGGGAIELPLPPLGPADPAQQPRPAQPAPNQPAPAQPPPGAGGTGPILPPTTPAPPPPGK
jgi:general secretion pathway protein D